MIEFTLACDRCGRIIVASKVSAADARRIGRLLCSAVRLGRQDLCEHCVDEIAEPEQ